MPVFPVKCSGSEKLKYIFPIMQKQVQLVIEKAEKNQQIKRVIIFGSAVTSNCGIGSDLDIAIDAPDITSEDDFLSASRPIRKALDVDADIIHYNTIKSRILLDEINRKGVDVYVNGI